jgi:hypothetical protein
LVAGSACDGEQMTLPERMRVELAKEIQSNGLIRLSLGDLE